MLSLIYSNVLIKFQDTQQIIYGNSNYCIAANESNHKLQLEKCNHTNANQMWSFGYFNATKAVASSTYEQQKTNEMKNIII